MAHGIHVHLHLFGGDIHTRSQKFKQKDINPERIMNGKHGSLLLIGNSLDIETESRADNASILSVNFQYDRSFPRIVKASEEQQSTTDQTESNTEKYAEEEEREKGREIYIHH